MKTGRDIAALLVLLLATAWIGETAYADGGGSGGILTNCDLPAGPVTTFSYTYDTGISREIEPAVPTEVSDPVGFVTIYTYSPPSEVLEAPPGTRVGGYTYDASDNVITSNLPAVQTGTTTVQSGQTPMNSRTTTVGGGEIMTMYDGIGRQTMTLTPPGSSTGDTTMYQYDRQGNVISHNAPDSHGIPTHYTDDSYTGSASMTDPLGLETKYVYDGTGNVVTQTAPSMGHETTTTYDTQSRTTDMTDPLGNTSSYQFLANDSLSRYTVDNSPGNTTTNAYDGYDRLTTYTDPLGNTTSYQYDSTDDRVTQTQYDSLGRLTSQSVDDTNDATSSTTDPLGRVTSYAYDTRDNLTRTIDSAGDITTQDAYDATGSIISPLGITTTYNYQTSYDLTETLGSRGPTYTFTYDVIDRIIMGGDTTQYNFNSTGTLTPQSDWTPLLEDYLYDGSYSFSSTSGLGQTGTLSADYLVSFVPLPASSLCAAALMTLLAIVGRGRKVLTTEDTEVTERTPFK